MIGHATFWVAAATIGVLCFVRAWHLGKEGLDDQQVVRVDKFAEVARSKLWVLFGAGLVLAVFIDAFLFFNPPPR